MTTLSYYEYITVTRISTFDVDEEDVKNLWKIIRNKAKILTNLNGKFRRVWQQLMKRLHNYCVVLGKV